MMDRNERAPTARTPLQWLGHVLAQILVGIYVTVDSILGPIFGPFMRWLSNWTSTLRIADSRLRSPRLRSLRKQPHAMRRRLL